MVFAASGLRLFSTSSSSLGKLCLSFSSQFASECVANFNRTRKRQASFCVCVSSFIHSPINPFFLPFIRSLILFLSSFLLLLHSEWMICDSPTISTFILAGLQYISSDITSQDSTGERLPGETEHLQVTDGGGVWVWQTDQFLPILQQTRPILVLLWLRLLLPTPTRRPLSSLSLFTQMILQPIRAQCWTYIVLFYPCQ